MLVKPPVDIPSGSFQVQACATARGVFRTRVSLFGAPLQALSDMDGFELDGRNIHVSKPNPKGAGGAGGGQGGGGYGGQGGGTSPPFRF